jgi:hypothetical protein
MSLSCGCDYYDGYASLYRATYRKARKEHVCIECHTTIKKGETYEYEISLFEGDFSTKKTCEKCSDLAYSLMDLGFCWEAGDLAISYVEYIDEYIPQVRKYNEEEDEFIYPENHLINKNGEPRKWDRITVAR